MHTTTYNLTSRTQPQKTFTLPQKGRMLTFTVQPAGNRRPAEKCPHDITHEPGVQRMRRLVATSSCGHPLHVEKTRMLCTRHGMEYCKRSFDENLMWDIPPGTVGVLRLIGFLKCMVLFRWRVFSVSRWRGIGRVTFTT